jgi:hypothetical protein
VSSAGDVNGDGFDDLVIGAYGADASGNAKSYAGESYVIFGGDFLGGVMFAGTAEANTLPGTVAAETFVSGQGNDTLIGAGGADAFQAGAGDDLMVVSDALFHHVDGGGGENDVLRLEFVGTINLGDLDSNAATSERGVIAGIEVLDLGNGLSNILLLGIDDVLDLKVQGTDVNGEAAIDNALRILGDTTGDAVGLQGAWTNNGIDSAGPGFQLVTTTIAGDAVKILIDNNVNVSII